jgi:hypothetical protein
MLRTDKRSLHRSLPHWSCIPAITTGGPGTSATSRSGNLFTAHPDRQRSFDAQPDFFPANGDNGYANIVRDQDGLSGTTG